MNIQTFLNQLWESYKEVTPQAAAIQKLFLENGERVVNDHVAFRTFNLAPINLENIKTTLESIGYKYDETYYFEKKKLRAYSFLPPALDQPLIFASELLTEQLSESAQNVIQKLVAQVPEEKTRHPDFLTAGLLWNKPILADYLTLKKENEYAAWMSTMGLRPNHFTVSVNHLVKMDQIGDVLTAVRMSGYKLNDTGGLVKGSPQVLLEQGSTMADTMAFKFGSGEVQQIPTCFYEFAKRYQDENGNLFRGFIADNADKIFESTNQLAV